MRHPSLRYSDSFAAPATAYLGALGLAPWLSVSALLFAAVATLATLGWGWDRSGRPATPAWAAGLWAPLHLSLLATGGMASPLVPLLAPWVLLIGVRGERVHAARAAGAALALLLVGVAWTGGLTVLGAATVVVALAGGLAPVWWIQRLRDRSESDSQALERIRAEVEQGAEASVEAEAARRIEELDRALDLVRSGFGARRATLWRIDADAERAVPWVVAGGKAPPVVMLSGDPMRWVWEEGQPLRVADGLPHWAAGSERLGVAPLDPFGDIPGLLTLECGPATEELTIQELEEAALYLLGFVKMQRSVARAVARSDISRRVIEVLQGLPKEVDLTAFARSLAESVRSLGGGSGAAVGSWEQERGRVLAVVGDDGGPEVGAIFGPMESELALAAVGRARIVRESRRRGRDAVAVAAPGEHWVAEPRALVALPLAEPTGGVTGAVAVWTTGKSPLDPSALEAVETIAPYAALSLRNASEFGSWRENADWDAVTGLHNRRSFEERLAHERPQFSRYRRPAALIMLDIDHFKRVNDVHGHEAGDAALRAVGQAVRASVREVDFPARFGGEEFVVLLPETALGEAREVAERLRRRVAETAIDWDGRRVSLTASLGVSSCPECVGDPAELVGSADAALYAAKTAGRDRVAAASLAESD